jgi:hypothetical protein
MNNVNCPVCSQPLVVTIARGRKSNKPFIMLKCNTDGRHFRGFITDQVYVKSVMLRLNTKTGMGMTGTVSLLGKPCISTENRGHDYDSAPAG